MQLLLVLAVGLAVVAALPASPDRIIGGSVTTIGNYPFGVSLLSGSGNNFRHLCGGSIVTNRYVLTAAHCADTGSHARWRSRVGSTNANSGGVVHNSQYIRGHPSYNRQTLDNDVSLIRTTDTFTYNNNVRAGSIAGANYNLSDNTPVYAIGWGYTTPGGNPSEQLRHVQVWTVNQATCRSRYAELRYIITDNMLCSGYLDVGGRDQCQGDSGGPLVHNGNIIVGVCSWGEGCALARYPGVNTRVSRYATWIKNNT